jgi:16S rRNA (uracil1498-N3)-methyltransferase
VEGVLAPEAAAQVLVDDVAAPVPDEADSHHLRHVLRLRPGERVLVTDGRGAYRLCALAAGARLEPVSEICTVARLEPRLRIAFSLTKGDRPEWVVSRLTELGIDEIVPITSTRTVVRLDAATARRRAGRLRRVAREAAMQSRRMHLPEVAEITTFADAVTAFGAAGRHGGDVGDAVLADLGSKQPPSLEATTVFVGPEGGWSDDERRCGLATVSLGGGVLRAETAAVAAGTLISALRSGIVRSAQ